MSKKHMPAHVEGLHAYLSQPSERNEDLALTYFRHLYGESFKRQSDAKGSDGYVAGHFVLELKGNTQDWYSALFQGLAYQQKGLAFSVVVVAAKHFLAAWNVDSIPSEIREEIASEKGAPSAVGKKIARKYSSKKLTILKKAAWHRPEIFDPLFSAQAGNFNSALKSFEKTLNEGRKVRQPINTKNFVKILATMKQFFDSKQPIRTVRAFYSMIYGPWDEASLVMLNQKNESKATLGGVEITDLNPSKRSKFKEFVENYSIQLSKTENIDDFFARYDEALDAVDKDFRMKNGIFFTDLDLSKFSMWFVKQNVPNLGRNYLVVDPACGSGNLVTNWRSPLELRHKVVSEIEPELLYAVEQRMKGDQWHNGKFTVVPKVSENKGLNFLDKSAREYLDILRGYLKEKGEKPDKPIAFLCNPPYRSDDDQSAEKIDYKISEEIIDLIDKDASSERFCCFLAQMKLICNQAEESGFPDESVLLLFTQTAWLTKRPIYQKIRKEIFGSFEDIGGFLVNAKEFFDVKGTFPIAFTMWKFKGRAAVSLDVERSIPLIDLTHLKKAELKALPWHESSKIDEAALEVLNSGSEQHIGLDRNTFCGDWVGFGRKNLYRNLTKEEKKDKSQSHLGLPKADPRHSKKTIYGHKGGESIGFLLDLTPCRISLDQSYSGKPWFYLDSRFLKVNTNRCFSGIPDSRAYCATTNEIAEKLFLWFGICRTFAQCGYPMWANMLEVWIPEVPADLSTEVGRVCAAIVFAENDCIEATFPANNPVSGAPEICVSNPLTPLNPESFWQTNFADRFKKNGERDLPAELVSSVNTVFNIWNQKVEQQHGRINCEFERPYFIDGATLSKFAGLNQIKSFASETNDVALMSAINDMTSLLKTVKENFHHLLLSKKGLNYFGAEKRNISASKKLSANQVGRFESILDKRKSLVGLVVDELQNDKNFGAVKLAKIIYIADSECNLGLDANYVKDVAGPVDGRLLYNEKIGIFPNGMSSDLGKINDSYFTKGGKKIKFRRIIPGAKTKLWAQKSRDLFKNHINTLEEIVNLFRPLTTEHSEAIATLYACWNDLLITGKKPTEENVIAAFYKWGPEKKKFSAVDLQKTIKWMKSKKLIPKGTGKKLAGKYRAEKDVPF